MCDEREKLPDCVGLGSREIKEADLRSRCMRKETHENGSRSRVQSTVSLSLISQDESVLYRFTTFLHTFPFDVSRAAPALTRIILSPGDGVPERENAAQQRRCRQSGLKLLVDPEKNAKDHLSHEYMHPYGLTGSLYRVSTQGTPNRTTTALLVLLIRWASRVIASRVGSYLV